MSQTASGATQTRQACTHTHTHSIEMDMETAVNDVKNIRMCLNGSKMQDSPIACEIVCPGLPIDGGGSGLCNQSLPDQQRMESTPLFLG